MKIIGLTGPAGAGKNEVARILSRRGALVIDVDRLAHTLYLPQTDLWHKLAKAFGSKILNRGGKINRRKLGEIVFKDKKKLKLLNRIAHPELKKAVINKIDSCKSSVVSCKLIVINAAVLKEIGLVDLCDEVWLVWASREKRKKRSSRPVRFQMNKKEYLKFSDVVIDNNGTRESLKKKVSSLL